MTAVLSFLWLIRTVKQTCRKALLGKYPHNKKSPNTGLGHTYRITPYHENPVGPTFYGIIVCSPLQLMFCCSITTPYIAYIEDNPQNTTLKIISRHV